MLLGYNTNGMAHHELFDAIRLLAEIGYRSVAITIDHTALPPYGSYHAQRRRRLRRLLDELGMRSVIETARGSSWTRRKSTSRLLSRPAPKAAPGGSTSPSMPSIVPPSWGAIAFRFGRAWFPRALPGRRP